MKTLEDVLEEIRPTPDPDFVADMERRMKLRLPPPRAAAPAELDLSRIRPRPVVAVAASALLALLITVSVTGGARTKGSRPAAQPLVEEVAPTAGGSGGPAPAADASAARSLSQPVPPPIGGEDFAPGADVRRIERSAQLTLAADPDDFDSLADAIFRTADRHDGFVLNSLVHPGRGRLQHRVVRAARAGDRGFSRLSTTSHGSRPCAPAASPARM